MDANNCILAYKKVNENMSRSLFKASYKQDSLKLSLKRRILQNSFGK